MYLILFVHPDFTWYFSDFFGIGSEFIFEPEFEKSCGFENEEDCRSILETIDKKGKSLNTEEREKRMEQWQVVWIDSRTPVRIQAQKKGSKKPPFTIN